MTLNIPEMWLQFSVPQIEYTLGGSSKKGSHVYFLLSCHDTTIVTWLYFCDISPLTMVALEQHLYQTIVLPRKLGTGSTHDYLFCYCPLEGMLFEVLRIMKCNYYSNYIHEIKTMCLNPMLSLQYLGLKV